jgi:sugar-specific transcriptional regulator TrmB
MHGSLRATRRPQPTRGLAGHSKGPMSAESAVAALKRLGLSTYEARVFVALQELGSGTAAEVSDVSEVPRSQVYGAADELAERGLLEVIETAPKTYRPVDPAAASTQLRNRLEEAHERATQNLETLRSQESTTPRGEGVATLRGRQPIDDRISELVRDAAERVVFVSPSEQALSEDLVGALRARATEGVDVTVLTATRAVEDRFVTDPIRVIRMDEDNPADFAGRALMVDDTTVLLAVSTAAEEPVEQEAVWTADTRIGRILATFMASGMESGARRSTEESEA